MNSTEIFKRVLVASLIAILASGCGMLVPDAWIEDNDYGYEYPKDKDDD